MNRMKKMEILVFVAALLIAVVTAYGASFPQLINYSGTLADKTGTPANGTYNMTFTVYSTATGGAPLWQERWATDATPASPVNVTNGAFNVMLGAVNPLPADFFAKYQKTFLGTKVGNDSEMVPRQRIASVGYSFAAGNGIPKNGIIMWSGSINQIPDGWALCDGANGTPDLRDRFIAGAGSSYNVGATGGVPTNDISHFHGLNGHTHSMQGHVHDVKLGAIPAEGSNNGYVTVDWKRRGSSTSDPSDAISQHYHPTYVSGPSVADTGGASGNTTPAGSNSLENRPPYYALAFIMKL